MAELSIKTIIDAGKKSLEDRNYWSALIVALTIPSMCSRIEYADEQHKGSNQSDEKGVWYVNNRGIVRWHDKKAYINWCNEWMRLEYGFTVDGQPVENDSCKDRFLVSIIGENYAEKLYEMRCNILHQCETDIEHGSGLPIFFSIGIGNTQLSEEWIVQINDICDEIFRYAERWLANSHDYDLPKRWYYDGNSNDDRLLYSKLCDNSRADHLLEQHDKELNRRNG